MSASVIPWCQRKLCLACYFILIYVCTWNDKNWNVVKCWWMVLSTDSTPCKVSPSTTHTYVAVGHIHSDHNEWVFLSSLSNPLRMINKIDSLSSLLYFYFYSQIHKCPDSFIVVWLSVFECRDRDERLNPLTLLTTKKLLLIALTICISLPPVVKSCPVAATCNSSEARDHHVVVRTNDLTDVIVFFKLLLFSMHHRPTTNSITAFIMYSWLSFFTAINTTLWAWPLSITDIMQLVFVLW